MPRSTTPSTSRTKRIRVNVLWARQLVDGAESRTVPARGAEVRLPSVRHPRGPRGQTRHQAPADDRLPRACPGPQRDHRVGNNTPDAAKFGEFARTVATHFAGPRGPLLDLERAQLEHLAVPGQECREQPSRPLYTSGYNAIKGVDPQAKVLIGEAGADRLWLCDRAAEVPARPDLLQREIQAREEVRAAEGRRLRDPPLPVLARSQPGAQQGQTTCRSAQLSRLTKALDKLAKRKALVTPNKRKTGALPDRVRLPDARARAPRSRRSAPSGCTTPSTSPAAIRACASCCSTSSSTRRATEIWHSAILDRNGRPSATYAGLAKASAANR